MTPEQAWQTAIRQLQTEMPKTTFDTWVREARFLSFEDSVFTIGVSNAYTRDWLGSRLTSTLTRILAGIMNQNTGVHFVVHPYETQDNGGKHTETQSPETQPLELSDDQIEILYLSIRDEIIKPEQVVVIPGYFKRWLPYLGPTLSWIVVAFRQILYLQSGGNFKTGYAFTAPWSELSKWSGLSRATIGRHKDDPMLGWFLTRIEQENKWVMDPATGRPKQRPSAYQFIASMPMTPGDQDVLYNRLMNTGIQEDPIATLQQLNQLQPSEILPYPPPAPKPEQINRLPTPRSVQDIVRIACGKKQNSINSQINQLADALANRLMPPTDNIVITHYFLQNHVRNLGAGPAWMITLLRDDIYYNSETGELRDTVWLSGGYQEIADRIGLSRHRTVSEWLPPVFERKRQRRGKDNARKQRRARTREIVKQFLKIVDHQQNDQGHFSLKFRVILSEPFTPLDRALYNLSFDIFNTYLSTGSEEFLEKVLGWDISGKDAFETLKTRIKDAFETLKDATDTSKDAFETLEARIKDALETLEDATETQKDVSKTRLRLLKHLINHLKRKHYQLNTSTTTIHTNSRIGNDGGEGVVVVDVWDFEKLLRIGGLADEKIQWVLRNIASDPAMGQRLVAWCLYGYANKTRNDRQGINAPVLFAVSRYAKAEPNPDYLALAQKSPDQLLKMAHSFYTPDLTRSQRKILDSLQSNGFISMLRSLARKQPGQTPQPPDGPASG